MADSSIIVNIQVRDEATARLRLLRDQLRDLEAQQSAFAARSGAASAAFAFGPDIQRVRSEISSTINEVKRLDNITGGLSFENVVASAMRMRESVKGIAASVSEALNPTQKIGRSAEDAARAFAPLIEAQDRLAAKRLAERQQAEAEAAERKRTLESLAASSAAFAARPPRPPRPPREEEPEIDTLAGRWAALTYRIQEAQQTLSKLSVGTPIFRDLENSINKDIERLAILRAQIGDLIAVGNTGGKSDALELFLNTTINQEMAALRAKEFQEAGALYTSIKANEHAYAESVASIKAASAAHDQLERAAARAATAGKKVGSSVAEGGDLAVLSVRKVSSAFDELSRHQTGAFISTLGSFVRQAGLLNAAINALSGPWGAFAAAGVAALAAVGYEAEQLYQRFSSIRDSAGQLAVRGFGDQTVALTAQFDRWRAATDEYAGTIKKMQVAAAALPPAAQGIVQSLHDQATAIAGLTGQDPAKIFLELTKAAQNSPEALAKVRSALLGLQNATMEGGLSIADYVKSAGNQVDAYERAATAGTNLRQREIEVGNQARTAASDFTQNVFALGALAGAGVFASDAVSGLGESIRMALDPASLMAGAEDQISSAELRLQGAINDTNSVLTTRIALLNRLATLSISTDIGGRPHEGTSGRQAPPLGHEAERQTGLQRTTAELLHSPLPAEQEEQHRITLDNINAEAQARKADLQAQLQAAQARAAEERRYETEKLTLGATPENRMSADEVSRRVEASEAVKKADEAVAEAQRRLSDESTQHQISNLRAIVAEEARGSQERINAQRQIIAIDQVQVALGREKPEKIDQDKIQLGNLVRQAQTRAFQEERDNARAAIIDAKDHANAVEEVAKAYDHLRAVSGQPGVPSATGAQINREEIRDLKSIQEQSFSRLEEFNHSAERLDNARLAAAKASLSAQVSAHQMSKEDEARAEANLTSSYLSEQEKRIQSELEIDGITEKEKQRLYQELAQLYTKDAEAQEKAQQKITAAIQEENQKRIQSFTTMFDSIGSGLEKVLTAELTGNLAERGSALRSFGQTLVSSTIKAVTSQISDYAGRQIGPALGLTEEQSKGGLGEVLGSALAKSLGLLKDTPKDNQQKSVDLLQKAADAQGKANNLLGDVVKNTADTAKLIQELLNKIKADGSVKTVNGTQTSATGITGTGAGVAPEASVTRSSIQIGGAATAPEGQPDTDIQVNAAPKQRSSLNLPALPDSPYIETARAAARQYNVPEDMFLHQIAGESGFRPNARNAVGQGHFGLGQFDPATARQYGVDVNDPTSSLYGAAHYISDLRSQAGGFAPAMQRYLGSTSESSLQRVLSQNPQYAGAYRLAQQADASTRGRYAENVLTEQTGVRQTATSVPTDTNFGITIGDSIAAGMIRHGAPGEEVKMGTLGGTAAVGRTPEQVLADIQSIDPKKIVGQNVLLSTGLSNAPSQFDTVQQQIDALKADQAKSITLLGVGTKPTFAGLNDKLAELAKNQDNVAFGGPLSQVGKDQVHPEMRGGVSGYTVNLEQAQQRLSENIGQLNTTTRESQSVQQQDVQVTNQLVQSQQRSVDGLDKNTQADQQLKTSTDNAAQAYKQKPAGAPANDNSGSTSSASSGLSLLTQGLGIAGSAAAIFGGQLSTTARVALGVVGVLSQLSSFTKNVTSTLGLFESSTKTATTATTLMQGASTINATAFATDTAAVQTNAAAQTTSAASSTGGSFLKAIPLIGGLFDRGGIVPSAAGGMIVPEGALAGGGQVSILHPREMVLPANISETVQNAARGRTNLPGMPSLSMPAPVTHNAANSNMTYAPQITGRFGSMSRTELNSVLRSHGDAFEGMARNLLRNNGLFRSAG